MNVFISIILFLASVFLLVLSVRFGLKNMGRLDSYFSQKNNSNYLGFQWFYRIPFGVGAIPEYFYAVVLSYESYFKRNWWPLKTASFISVLVFVATLKDKSAVANYFSFNFVKENGISALFNSGNFIILLNIISLLILGLFILLCIESIKMHGIYAPIRIFAYGLLSLLMANLTIIMLSIIIFFVVIYILFQILKFIVFSYRYRRRYGYYYEDKKPDDTLKKGFNQFKKDLYIWEEESKNETTTLTEVSTEPTQREKPKITRRRKLIVNNTNEIQGLRPNKP